MKKWRSLLEKKTLLFSKNARLFFMQHSGAFKRINIRFAMYKYPFLRCQVQVVQGVSRLSKLHR